MGAAATASAAQDQEKRRAILAASCKTFADKGFRNADVEVIAREAGVGKGTVYRYFGNKEELFLATADDGMRRLKDHCLGILAGVDDPLEAVYKGARAYAQFFQEHPELVEILIIERAEFRGSIPDTHMTYREEGRGIPDEIIARAIRQGVFRDVDVRSATDTITNLLYGTVVCACLSGSSASICQLADEAVDIFLHGVLATTPSDVAAPAAHRESQTPDVPIAGAGSAPVAELPSNTQTGTEASS